MDKNLFLFFKKMNLSEDGFNALKRSLALRSLDLRLHYNELAAFN
jgi:hypothetical protein